MEARKDQSLRRMEGRIDCEGGWRDGSIVREDDGKEGSIVKGDRGKVEFQGG